MKCRNGIDYDACENEGSIKWYGYCPECFIEEAEEAHEGMLSDFYGGSQAVTLKEKIEQAEKENESI